MVQIHYLNRNGIGIEINQYKIRTENSFNKCISEDLENGPLT